MEIKTYSELIKDILCRGSQNYDCAMNSLSSVMPVLSKKYSIKGDVFEAEMPLSLQIPFISHLVKGKIKGKRILDLGCGSKRFHEIDLTSRFFEPWLCRTLHELGAYPVGVDKEDNSEEEFKSYQVDLQRKNSLKFLQTGSFDIANMRGLLTSRGFRGDAKKLIFPQLERIVKPGGYLIYSEDF